MPLVSQAQHRFMEWRAHEPPKKARREKGPSPEVARRFLNDSKGQNIKALPERVKKK